MARKKRVAIPQRTRTRVLKEFRHRCAICGTSEPHLHHIDEDPSNNKADNLLPLCPNCHLIDLHSPTTAIDPEKLALFRRFKDPTILSSQFDPLFRRYQQLKDPPDGLAYLDVGTELLSFIENLKMGAFYRSQLAPNITRIPRLVRQLAELNKKPRKNRSERLACEKELDQLQSNATSLLVELLRYQDWEYTVDRSHVTKP